MRFAPRMFGGGLVSRHLGEVGNRPEYVAIPIKREGSDTVPTILTRGELVVNRENVPKVIPLLAKYDIRIPGLESQKEQHGSDTEDLMDAMRKGGLVGRRKRKMMKATNINKNKNINRNSITINIGRQQRTIPRIPREKPRTLETFQFASFPVPTYRVNDVPAPAPPVLNPATVKTPVREVPVSETAQPMIQKPIQEVPKPQQEDNRDQSPTYQDIEESMEMSEVMEPPASRIPQPISRYQQDLYERARRLGVPDYETYTPRGTPNLADLKREIDEAIHRRNLNNLRNITVRE